MNNIDNLVSYNIAVVVLKALLTSGIINEENYKKCEEKIADKYNLSNMSVFRHYLLDIKKE